MNTFAEDLQGLLDENLYRLLTTPSMFFIGALTILPLAFMICMAYVTTPYLITTFTGNVNNFNVIYLLSGGDPVTDLASTDLLAPGCTS